MVKAPILEIFPNLNIPVSCPSCGSTRATVQGVLFQGIHVLQSFHCEDCSVDSCSTLPAGHDALWPIAFSKDGTHVRYDAIADLWLARPLLKGMVGTFRSDYVIEKKIYRQNSENAVLLNCLDYCFGHAFAKLWNIQAILESYPEFSVIVLIPENFEWLIPEGVSEVWLVRGKMREMNKYMVNLDSQIKSEISRFSKFYLSTAKVFHDTSKINFEIFLRKKSFDISAFTKMKPCVTFVLREDRYWHGNAVEEFVNRALIKFEIQKYFTGYFIWRQNSLVRKTIKHMKKQRSDVKFVITGFGKKTFSDGSVEDRRVGVINDTIEHEWCECYSQSHISIGVHGSNMLIPTMLSAGFIEILPSHKIQHIGEDTICRHQGRDAVFLARHVEAFVSPRLLAQHAIHMLSFGEIKKWIQG